MITHQIGFPPSLAFHNVVLSPRLVLFVCWIHDMATNIGQHRIHWWPHQLDNQLDRCLLGANTWRATINVPKMDFIANPTNASQCPKMSRSHSSRTSKSGFIKDTHNYTSCSGKNPYTLHLRSYSHGSTILFTDRLALGNLGPFTAAGLSASMMALFSKPIVSNLAVSILSMSYHGKLCALRLAQLVWLTTVKLISPGRYTSSLNTSLLSPPQPHWIFTFAIKIWYMTFKRM